jgi:hypothetical protein
MSDRHLRELEQLLTRRGWRVAEVFPGDEYRYAASWTIERGDQRLLLDFKALDYDTTLPLEQAHACSVRGHSGVSLYFGKRASAAHPRRRWSSDLEAFVAALDTV